MLPPVDGAAQEQTNQMVKSQAHTFLKNSGAHARCLPRRKRVLRAQEALSTSYALAMKASHREVLARLASVALGLILALSLCEGVLWLYEDQLIGRQLDSMGIARPGTSDRNVNKDWGADGSSPLHIRSDEEGLVYAMRPNAEVEVASMNWRVETNSDGFRDAPFARIAPPGTYRIAAVGDSVTLGFWVERAESWPDQLEDLLNRTSTELEPSSCHFEVMNFGVTGYDLGQEVELVRTRVLNFAPEALVLAITSNDEEIGADAGLWRHFTRSRSRTWDFFSLRWMRRQREAEQDRSTPRLIQLKELIAGSNIPVLVVLFPDLDPSIRENDLKRRKRIAESARSQGFQVLDLGPFFDENGGPSLGIDTVHPTPEGHRLSAKEIAHELRQSGLLSCTEADVDLGVRK
jgi:lysophospholipase L1-like esterase